MRGVGLPNLSRLSIVAVGMVVGFAWPLGATSAQAAGCHVPDRPILGSHAPIDNDRHIAAWDWSPDIVDAPAVLTHLPCPDEIPHVPAATTMMPAAEAGLFTKKMGLPVRPESAWTAQNLGHFDPRSLRLDRPPR